MDRHVSYHVSMICQESKFWALDLPYICITLIAMLVNIVWNHRDGRGRMMAPV